MRKKLISIILILIMSTSVFYGCGFIRINNEKDFAQVIAVVGDEKYNDEITKKDLVYMFYNQGQQYIEQYKMTTKETMELLLEQLINNRIIVQEGTRALIETNNLDNKEIAFYLNKDADSGKKSDSMKKLFNDDNKTYEKALSNVYKYEKETLDYYEEEYNKEQAIPDPSETPEPTPTPTPTPRPTIIDPDVKPSETVYPPNPTPTTAPRIEALRRLKDNLDDKKMSYDDFLEEALVSQLENEIIEHYQKYLFSDIRISYEDMVTRCENMTKAQKQQYLLDINAYSEKLKSANKDTFLLYNPVEGYGYVKNLLIPFSEEQAAQLAEMKTKQWSQSQYLTERQKLLNQVKAKDLKDYENEEDREADIEIITFYQDKIVDSFNGVKEGDIYKNTSLTDVKTKEFIDLIFQYGSDPGMFNNEMDYLSSPKPESGTPETYVIEFAKAARQVITAGLGSYTMVGTDFGWHIIICTEVLSKDSIMELDQAMYNQIQAKLVDNIEFEDIEKVIKDTFTYKIYDIMRGEIKMSVFNTIVADVIADSKVEKFESRYSELLK